MMSLLEKCPLFEGFENDAIAKRLRCLSANLRAFEKGEAVILEGDAAERFGIVIKGCVLVEQIDQRGNRTLVDWVNPSQMFGEAFSFSQDKIYSVTITAAERSEILFIRSAAIYTPCEKNCQDHNRLVFNMLKNMSVKNEQLHSRLKIISKRTTKEKLEAYLLGEAKRQGRLCFKIPFDRQALADYLCVDRSALSSVISEMKREGLIESEKSQFVLKGIMENQK